MATAEKKLAPKKRPAGLTRTDEVPGGNVPALKQPFTKEDTLEWAENLRDRAEMDGKLLTVKGLVSIARNSQPITASPEIVRDIKSLYAKEYEKEKTGREDVIPPKASANGNGKAKPTIKKTVNSNTKTTNGKTKPTVKKTPSNGSVVKKKEKIAHRVIPGETVKIKNITKIPVTLEKVNSRSRVRIYGHAFRGVLRWTGQDGWTKENTVNLLTKLGLMAEKVNPVGETMSLDSVINDHMASGRKGDKGWHGPPAPITDTQAAALRSAAGFKKKSK